MTPPRILALDFDGVVCDGRPEYFETAWQAYVAAWPAPALTSSRPARIAARFSALRPLIESGWEMPLLVHALLAGAGGLRVRGVAAGASRGHGPASRAGGRPPLPRRLGLQHPGRPCRRRPRRPHPPPLPHHLRRPSRSLGWRDRLERRPSPAPC